MDRHYRKELPQSPMIEERLKDWKITEILIAECDLEFFDFFRHISHASTKIDNCLGDLPINGFDLGFAFQIQQAKLEHRLRLFFNLLGIMQVLHSVLLVHRSMNFDDVGQKLRIRFLDFEYLIAGRFLDRTKGLNNQHRTMSDYRPT